MSWKALRAPETAARRSVPFKVSVTATIDPGWHLYALEEPQGGPEETVFGLADGDPAELLHVDETQPETVMDAAFAQRTLLFRGRAAFTLTLQLAKEATAATALHIIVRYQACNAHLCLPPRREQLDVPLSGSR